jgi:hypothetical protein
MAYWEFDRAAAKRVQALPNDIMFVRMRRGRPGWPAAKRA